MWTPEALFTDPDVDGEWWDYQNLRAVLWRNGEKTVVEGEAFKELMRERGVIVPDDSN